MLKSFKAAVSKLAVPNKPDESRGLKKLKTALISKRLVQTNHYAKIQIPKVKGAKYNFYLRYNQYFTKNFKFF